MKYKFFGNYWIEKVYRERGMIVFKIDYFNKNCKEDCLLVFDIYVLKLRFYLKNV